MKYFSFIYFLLLFAIFAVLPAKENQITDLLKEKSESSFLHSLEISLENCTIPEDTCDFYGGIIWVESFEMPRRWSKWSKWKSKDLTLPRPDPIPSQWIPNDWEAYDGVSWRCADLTSGNSGGYGDYWYQALDTPPLILEENAVFSFYHRYSAQNPASATQPYDAWDGMNVRISTNGGTAWEVLPAATYNVSSILAFGHSEQGHNESEGIPGWAGEMADWTIESIDLTAFTGSKVILRFAFASDRDLSSNDDLSMFGWQIDNIEVKSLNKTYFTNYGSDDNMTSRSNEFIPPAGGSLWHVVKFVEPISPLFPEFKPFGRRAAACQNSGRRYDPEASYNPYMDNVFSTGPISLPEATPIYLDFKAVPDFYDDDDFPNADFFRPEIRHVDSTEWETIEQPPQDYSFGFNQWFEFSRFNGYPMNLSMFNLSRFAGEDIFLRFRFQSDDDQPIGSGLLIDDIVIYSPTFDVPAPRNVQAAPNPADTSITVSWNRMFNFVNFFIYRSLSGSAGFQLVGQQRGGSEFIDNTIDPFYEYDYIVLSKVKYFGESAPSNVASASIIPEGVLEVFYDDAEADGYFDSELNKNVAVKFVPPSFPVTISTFKVYLVKGNTKGSTGKFSLIQVDFAGLPGATLQTKNKSGLKEGFNIIEFNSPETITENGFFIAYSRFSDSPYIAVDTDPIIDANTFIETGSGWEQKTDFDAIIHAFVGSENLTGNSFAVVAGIESQTSISKDFVLARNYPNPFNPLTNIEFNVPLKAADQNVTVDVFNMLGQKVAALFNGRARTGINRIQWKGVDDAGNAVPSGIYIYRLKGKNIQLTERMLLVK